MIFIDICLWIFVGFQCQSFSLQITSSPISARRLGLFWSRDRARSMEWLGACRAVGVETWNQRCSSMVHRGCGSGCFFSRKKQMIENTCMLIDVDQSRLLVQVQELLARKLICKSLEFSLRVNISKIFFCINFSWNGSLHWPFPKGVFRAKIPCQVALCHPQIWLKTWTKLSQSKARQFGISPWKFNSEFSTEK